MQHQMQEYLTFALTVFTGFFAVMNPIANTPIFLGIVGDAGPEKRREISRKSTLITFGIIVAFVLLGKLIFQLFGITIPAFKITGGILIFFIGVDMLRSKVSSMHDNNVNADVDISVAVSPLAVPILAGPGTIVTAMNYVSKTDYIHMAIVIAVFAVLCFLTYLAFVAGEIITKKLGQNLIMVIGKIMGLIIAIIGTSMVIEGIKLAFLS